MGCPKQIQTCVAYCMLSIHRFDAWTESFLLVLVIKDCFAAFGFQFKRKSVGHGFFPNHIMPFDMQVITVFNEPKKVNVVNGTCENGRGFDDREKDLFHKQARVRNAIVAKKMGR